MLENFNADNPAAASPRGGGGSSGGGGGGGGGRGGGGGGGRLSKNPSNSRGGDASSVLRQFAWSGQRFPRGSLFPSSPHTPLPLRTNSKAASLPTHMRAQHTTPPPAYVNTRQHTSAHASMRSHKRAQHTTPPPPYTNTHARTLLRTREREFRGLRSEAGTISP
jgi:hypothetical protein